MVRPCMREFHIRIVKVKRWMKNRISLSQKHNPLHLFSLNWTKQHLPPICPSWIFNKSLLSIDAEAFAQLAIENKEVSSAIRYYSIILTLDISACGKSLANR